MCPEAYRRGNGPKMRVFGTVLSMGRCHPGSRNVLCFKEDLGSFLASLVMDPMCSIIASLHPTEDTSTMSHFARFIRPNAPKEHEMKLFVHFCGALLTFLFLLTSPC